MKTISLLRVATLLAAALAAAPVFGQNQISDSVKNQIAQIIALKDSFSTGEKKLSSNLALASRQAHSKPVGAAAPFVNPNIADRKGMVRVVIRGASSPALLKEITARGGHVDAVAPSNERIEATVPLMQLEGLAARPEIGSIRQPPQARTNVGSLTTQAYVSHRVKPIVEGASPITGSGIKVGVLSDTASTARIAALIASGDLGPTTTVLPGQGGLDPGSDEGAAMMEIVQDLAPGAQLYFATAFDSEPSFAANIIALGAAGCTVIVDDVTYSDEAAFQDSEIAQAVNTFVAGGGIYFSSAGNSGNLTNNNSTTWEGDFVDGGTNALLPPGYTVHNFGGGQTNDPISQITFDVNLFWADPLGGSTNDYDLFILNSTLTTIVAFSTSVQNGTQDPLEEVFNPSGFAANSRIVIARKAGSNLVAMHLDTFGSARLSIATSGATRGHNAGANTQSVAATYWNSAHNGTTPFNGSSNPTETFSSDGPRRIFFNPNGTAITPGNFRFGTNGGALLQKPDFTAADGVTTRTPTFNPFFGTSAAAPHAAGIAALIRSAHPALTNTQIHAILVNTALDNMTPGIDRDGGAGVLNALTAVP